MRYQKHGMKAKPQRMPSWRSSGKVLRKTKSTMRSEPLKVISIHDGAVFVVVYVTGADAHRVNGNLHVMGSDFQRQVDVTQRQFTFAFEY